MGRPALGHPELLAALAQDDRFYSSVLTGNIAPNAVVKLAAFGLEKWVDMESGAYGSDSEDRRDLVPIAIGRLASLRGVHLSAEETWVIGDTPRDYECAAAAGAHCLLVATGAYSDRGAVGLGADAVLADLTATDAVIDILSAGL